SAGRGRSIALVLGLALSALAAGALSSASQAAVDKPAGPTSKMLVESDQLVYDYDNNSVAAVGNVRIYYNGYTLLAEKVSLLRASGRLVASGRVSLTDASGITTTADEISLTDDFRDGFVTSLNVETPEKTYFSAERADRTGGERTTFINGTYTACEPCREHPEKPPFWRIRAAKIIVDQKEKEITFRDAKFEFLGVPIAWLPYFSVTDPAVTRKSGFLFPSFGQSDMLGAHVSAPYFWALSPSRDVTVTPTYYSRQGLLSEVEWRERTTHGQFTLQMAGIRQMDKEAFLDPSDGSGAGTYAQRDWRGGVRTTGEFDINQYWTGGWDATLSTDRTFTRNYGVLDGNSSETISFAHLTGLKDRNYFDARAYYFQILTDNPEEHRFDQGRQAVVLPVVDHDYTFDNPVLGGQVSIRSNLTALHRDDNDPFTYGGDTFYHGLAGNYARLSSQIDWQRRIIGPGGQVFTPFVYLRGDIFSLDPANVTAANALVDDGAAGRIMPAAGVEWSWPVMATTASSVHIFEPMAQLIVRPNEPMIGQLPNDDAQSLVFSDANLFSRDKFSGFDRVEGGTRLNLGLRYVGTFDNGLALDGLVGQSYQLAGENSFGELDIANTGALSGLETARSDYVARLAVDTGIGPRVTARGRFDEDTLAVQRAEVEATNAIGPITATASYLFLRDFPNNESVVSPTSVIRGAASMNVLQNWRVYGSVAYDITNSSMASNSVGLAYDNSCFTFAVAYNETREDYSDIGAQRRLNFHLQMRTLADTQLSTGLSGF
ncbi:MAG: LPS-assembly protein LptD, partial [Bauldia sp.]